MQLYLIRHAESENNARPEHERVEDPGITERGHQQADHLARWLQTLHADVLITSPFRRTLETTLHVVNQTGWEVHVWHEVFERGGCYRGFGDAACEGAMGFGRSQILQHLPTAVIAQTIDESGWWGGRPRETDDEVVLRAGRVIDQLIGCFGNTGQTVVAITHAEFKRHLLAQMLRTTAEAHRFGPLRNTGISRLNWDGQHWQLDWLNSVSHLPGPLITGAMG